MFRKTKVPSSGGEHLCLAKVTCGSMVQAHVNSVSIVAAYISSCVCVGGPPLWASGQSFWLQIQRSRVRFPALPDFLSSSGSGTGSTQPREVN